MFFNETSYMRQVVSFSLPTKEAQQIKQRAKKHGFNTMSAYILSLLKTDDDLISETELLRAVDEARKEYAAGKSVRASSLADLV